MEEGLQLGLIEMQCDDMENQYQLLIIPNFYESLDNDKFSLMRRHANRMTSLFSSTFICDKHFRSKI